MFSKYKISIFGDLTKRAFEDKEVRKTEVTKLKEGCYTKFTKDHEDNGVSSFSNYYCLFSSKEKR